MTKQLFFTILFLFVVLLHGFGQEYEVNVDTKLNVRAQPQKQANVLGSIADGEQVYVHSIVDGWAHITYGQQDGYISSEYIIPLATQTTPSTFTYTNPAEKGKRVLPFIALALGIVLFIFEKRSENVPRRGTFLTAYYVFFMLLCISEFLYFLLLKGDTWFCNPSTVGWIWTIVNFFLFAFILYSQIMAYFSILEDIEDMACHYDYRIGLYSYAVCIVLGIICSFFVKWAVPYVIMLLCIAQLIQIIVIFYKARNRYLKITIASVVLYVTGSLALLMTLLHFISLLIVAALIYMVLKFLGESGERCCANCRTYDNGYCHYREVDVSSGGCCKHYIRRTR